MYYEINVSSNGKHLFATAERSITSIDRLKKVYQQIFVKFPKSEGFEISVIEYQKQGFEVKVDDINKYYVIKNGDFFLTDTDGNKGSTDESKAFKWFNQDIAKNWLNHIKKHTGVNSLKLKTIEVK